MSRPASRTLDILLVEDNPGDVRLTIEGLAEGNIRNRLHVARDGVEALEYLKRDGVFTDAVRPDLILLDLNLPRMGGREVLAALKSDPDLKAIPTIVLTTSCDQQDVSQSYALQANCYVTKPVDVDAFFGVLKSIENFWLTTAILPTHR
jgi:CheY-like chemotaxis protein